MKYFIFRDDKTVAIAFNNRGHSRYMQVKFDEAVEDYNEAIKLNPKLSVSYYNRGTIFYRLGKIYIFRYF